MKKIVIASAMLFAGLQTAHAGGYFVGEMSARSTGMASAFTAVADDASAAWHNPAGVAFTEGTQVMAGGAVIIAPGVDYTPNGLGATTAGSSDSGNFVIPHAYFTYWDENSKLGASLSVNSPFGLETNWPVGGPLQTSSTFSRVKLVMVNPSVIFKLSDRLSIAAGLDYVYLMNVDFSSAVQLLEGKNESGWGGNASVFYKGDDFNFGVTYRSRVKINVDGKVTGGSAITLLGAPASLIGASSGGKTSLTLPDQVNVGLALMPSDALTVSLDVDWVNWKTFDSIDITYAPSNLANALTAGTLFKSISENWKATVAVRVGAEWRYNQHMRARFGYIYDPSPIPDADFTPGIPGNDRHIFSAGFGYDMNAKTTLDLAYAYVYLKNRNQTASTGTNAVRNGKYQSDAHILMASVNHSF